MRDYVGSASAAATSSRVPGATATSVGAACGAAALCELLGPWLYAWTLHLGRWLLCELPGPWLYAYTRHLGRRLLRELPRPWLCAWTQHMGQRFAREFPRPRLHAWPRHQQRWPLHELLGPWLHARTLHQQRWLLCELPGPWLLASTWPQQRWLPWLLAWIDRCWLPRSRPCARGDAILAFTRPPCVSADLIDDTGLCGWLVLDGGRAFLRGSALLQFVRHNADLVPGRRLSSVVRWSARGGCCMLDLRLDRPRDNATRRLRWQALRRR